MAEDVLRKIPDQQAAWNVPLQFFFYGHFSVSQGHKGMGHSTPMSTIKIEKNEIR